MLNKKESCRRIHAHCNMLHEYAYVIYAGRCMFMMSFSRKIKNMLRLSCVIKEF